MAGRRLRSSNTQSDPGRSGSAVGHRPGDGQRHIRVDLGDQLPDEEGVAGVVLDQQHPPHRLPQLTPTDHHALAAARRTEVKSARPSVDGPVSRSTACSGCGISPTTRPSADPTPAMSFSEPFGLPPRVAEHDPAGRPPARPACRGRRRSGPPRSSPGRRSRRPRGRRSTPCRFSTRSRWSRQTKCRPALRTSAPGSRPASHRIWKPLQMPSTGRPAPGRVDDRRHHRGEAGDRACAQVVAVGEAAGHHHGVDAAQVGVGVPQRHGLGARDGGPHGRRPRRRACRGT